MKQFKDEMDQITTPEKWKKACQREAKRRKKMMTAWLTSAAAVLVIAGIVAVPMIAGNRSSQKENNIQLQNIAQSVYPSEKPSNTESTPVETETQPVKLCSTTKTIMTEGAAGGKGGTTYTEINEYGECVTYEFDEEYPVEKIQVDEGAIKQVGDINVYRHQTLPAASELLEIMGSQFNVSFHPMGNTTKASWDIGYDNYEGTGAESDVLRMIEVSCNTFTGRFSMSNWHSDDYYRSFLEEYAEYDLEQCDEKMRTAADNFAKQYESITGELQLATYKDEEIYLSVPGTDGALEWLITLTGRTYFYTSSYSHIELEAQSGLLLPSQCLSSNIDDVNTQYLTVTVLPDGTIKCADNYITSAPIQLDYRMPMIDENSISSVLGYMSSTTQDDTILIHSAEVGYYATYFGSPAVEPAIVFKYSFASHPDDIQSTAILSVGLWNR